MRVICLIVCFCASVICPAAEADSLDALRRLFPSATSYGHTGDESGAVKHLYFFFDKEGSLLGGAAVRSIKTYENLTGVLAVRKHDKTVEVIDVSFPDLNKIRKSSERRTVLKAARYANGRVVMDDGGKKTLDAVSGATRYKRNLFLNLNKMTSVLIDAIATVSHVQRVPLVAKE